MAAWHVLSSLLKNTRLLYCIHHSPLRRTEKYASFLMIAYAVYPDTFEQPAENHFFKNVLVPGSPFSVSNPAL